MNLKAVPILRIDLEKSYKKQKPLLYTSSLKEKKNTVINFQHCAYVG